MQTEKKVCNFLALYPNVPAALSKLSIQNNLGYNTTFEFFLGWKEPEKHLHFITWG